MATNTTKSPESFVHDIVEISFAASHPLILLIVSFDSSLQRDPIQRSSGVLGWPPEDLLQHPNCVIITGPCFTTSGLLSNLLSSQTPIAASQVS